MSALLVLLSNCYPYPSGESFIETELVYLKNQFELIDIIPVECGFGNIDIDQETHRPLPAGVHLRKDILSEIRQSSNFFSLVKQFITSLSDPTFNHLLYSELHHAFTFGPQGIANCLRIFLQARCIHRLLQKYYGKESQPIIWYSYWLRSAALAISLLPKDTSIAISRIHGFDLYRERHRIKYLPFQKEMLTRLDAVLPVSEAGLNHLLKIYPDNSFHLQLFRLGVEDHAMAAKPNTGKVFELVSCSTLTAVKRIDLLVRALQLCDFPLHWTHFGTGELESEIREAAKNLPSNVTPDFMGKVSNDTLLQYYQNQPIDVFINVSSSEGLPVTIMEAFSFGIPVIATDVGGTSELVSSETGRLIPQNAAPVDIMQTISAFRQLSPQEKAVLRKNCYQVFQDKVNANIQYPKFINFILNLLSLRNNPG